MDRVIFDELTQGRFRPRSRAAYAGVISRLADAGAEAVVLGCTEIGQLVGPEDSPLPLLDSMRVHAEAAADLGPPRTCPRLISPLSPPTCQRLCSP